MVVEKNSFPPNVAYVHLYEPSCEQQYHERSLSARKAYKDRFVVKVEIQREILSNNLLTNYIFSMD